MIDADSDIDTQIAWTMFTICPVPSCLTTPHPINAMWWCNQYPLIHFNRSITAVPLKASYLIAYYIPTYYIQINVCVRIRIYNRIRFLKEYWKKKRWEFRVIFVTVKTQKKRCVLFVENKSQNVHQCRE